MPARPRPFTFFAVLVLLLACGLVPARAMDHCGSITSDETWRAADSPHTLTCAVTVEAGATLTVEAGATVDLSFYYLGVKGGGTIDLQDGTRVQTGWAWVWADPDATIMAVDTAIDGSVDDSIVLSLAEGSHATVSGGSSNGIFTSREPPRRLFQVYDSPAVHHSRR